ncbi:MarR family transcriptional regulator [Ktedonosporobacter rubrisoli]|uniref:MarR family transcriptional regulator n=1 Tax=Ktedonosporobacter rubrisoli TaxID=2509675 RepID=A0A4P6JHW3_KTERU|nr:MarR family transcriptional regulator [Ktedonosporobacter rubrisoli]QBD74629.1 MarR family transcriptional regulator [Ktedonosporobacter rubrisoli]
MDLNREELIKRAQQAQKIIVGSFVREMALPSFLELDISMAQLKGLTVLSHHGKITVSQLAEQLQVGRSAASLLADRLVAEGLVERAEDSEDRRRTVLQLSQRGEELVAQLRRGRETRDPLPGWLSKMSDQDLLALVQGTEALAAEASATTGSVILLPEHDQKT